VLSQTSKEKCSWEKETYRTLNTLPQWKNDRNIISVDVIEENVERSKKIYPKLMAEA